MTTVNIQPEAETARRNSSGRSPGSSTGANQTLTRRVIRSVGINTLYQVFAQFAPAAAAIAAIPVLVRHLGPEAYGIVTLFSTALIYFAMLDLGLGRSTTRFVAQSIEARCLDDVARYFWSSLLLLTGAGLIVGLCFIFAVPVVVSHFLKIPPPYNRQAVESFYLISATIPLVTMTAALRGFLEASGRFAFLSATTACTGAGMYLLPMLVVLAGGRLVAVAATYVALRIGMAIAFAIGCLRVSDRPGLRPILDLRALRKMASFGGWLSVSNVIGTAMVYGDRFLLGSFVGMLAVTSYSMPLDVIGRIQIVTTSFCAVLFPLLSRLDGARSGQFQTAYHGASATVLSLITPLAVTAILFSPFLMKLWLREHSTPDAVFAAQVFLAGSIAQAMASISFTALHARGRSDLTAWVHLAEFPLYCAAFFWAATHFGVRGAALVWFGRVIVDFACMVVLLRMRERNHAFLFTPEMAAIVASIAVLVAALLRPPNAPLLGITICLLTWLLAWRTLPDPALRTRVVRAITSPRNAFCWLVGASRER